MTADQGYVNFRDIWIPQQSLLVEIAQFNQIGKVTWQRAILLGCPFFIGFPMPVPLLQP
jgi:hypothetical protein